MGAREAKGQRVGGRIQGACAYGDGQEGDDGETGETEGRKVAGVGEEDELGGKRKGSWGWRNVCGKGRGEGERQVKRGRVVHPH